MIPARNNQSGLSLLELIIALGIFITVSAGISEVLITTSDTYTTGMTIARLDTKGRRALDRMATSIVGAGLTTFVPNPDLPFGSTTLTFQRCAGFDSATSAVEWGPVTRFELRDETSDPEDGLDNDRDGLIDERELVQVIDVGGVNETEFVMLSGVTRYLQGEEPNAVDDNGNGLVDEEGLVFGLVGTRLTIHITVAGRAADGLMLERTVETSVVIRN